MKKMAVVYASLHHGNTEKLVRSVKGVDVFEVDNTRDVDFARYDIVGLASGIYMGKFHEKIGDFVCVHKKELKKVFLVYTSGTGSKKYGLEYKQVLEKEGLDVIDIYCCKGHDTMGPWKMVGGIGKNHPDDKDIKKYESFVERLLR